METNETLNQEVNEVTEEGLFDDFEETQEEGLFDDLVEDDKPIDSTNKENTPKQEEVEESHNKNPDTEESFITVRYNKKDTDLTREQTIEMAQKGMNYDKLMGDFQEFKAQFEELAERNGMDLDQWIKNQQENQLQFEIGREIEELRKQYPNSDAKLLEEHAKDHVLSRLQSKASNVEEKQKAIEKSKMDEIERQLRIAQRIYPNEDYDHLPSEVLAYMREGSTISEALTQYKHEQSQKIKQQEDVKAKASAKNEENKKKSLGNTINTSDHEEDDFMKGFDI